MWYKFRLGFDGSVSSLLKLLLCCKLVDCNQMLLFISVWSCINLRILLWESTFSCDWLVPQPCFYIFPCMLGKCVFRHTPKGYCSKACHQESHMIFIIALVHWPLSMCLAVDFMLVSYSHKSNAFLMWTYFRVNNLANGQLQGDPESDR